jgi:transglutaminase-like putative cysteine protease
VWRPAAVATAAALAPVGALAAARAGLPVLAGAVVAAGAGLLAVLALPSLSTRRLAVSVLAVGALGMVRHAELPGAVGTTVVLWAAAALVAFLLVDRADAERVPLAPGGRASPAAVSEVLRVSVVVAVLVVVATVALVPPVTRALGERLTAGAVPTEADRADAPRSLRSAEHLDFTGRPRLSDRVVFTVDAPRADFWRGETFDLWDGRNWSRSRRGQLLARLDPADTSGQTALVDPAPHDAGAVSGAAMRQTFRVEAPWSEIVFGAPSLVEVRAGRVVRTRDDGTASVAADEAFGRGATYTVVSRSLLPTARDLRAAAARPVPPEIAARYASSLPATARVRELATALTGDAPTAYDAVRAVEAWLGAHTEYSIGAPLPPPGVDVVDHFLFESRVGWCEQVASSMVVMLRSQGIPARLATGFVPGERDRLSGRFVVRERDAHAWAEVFFPGVGWQGFDPTAAVPLAGDAATGGGWLHGARDQAVPLAAVLAAALAGVVELPRVSAALRARARRRRSWVDAALARLERLGRRGGRPRRPSETPREFARALARRFDEPGLVEVGETLDREAFSRAGASELSRARVDQLLGAADVRPRARRR